MTFSSILINKLVEPYKSISNLFKILAKMDIDGYYIISVEDLKRCYPTIINRNAFRFRIHNDFYINYVFNLI